MLTDREIHATKPTRYLRKISDQGGLHLLVTPKGCCRWRYNYRFARRYRSLSLGIYPFVSLEDARSRHEFARRLLAHGFDPAALKARGGKHVFTVMMREWKQSGA
jgi:Arm DNA-binding domain